jgi:hypothetical protein
MIDKDDGEKALSKVVSALHGTPMLLVLVVLNLVILGMATYLIKARSSAMQAERTELITSLNKCIDELNNRN